MHLMSQVDETVPTLGFLPYNMVDKTKKSFQHWFDIHPNQKQGYNRYAALYASPSVRQRSRPDVARSVRRMRTQLDVE